MDPQPRISFVYIYDDGRRDGEDHRGHAEPLASVRRGCRERDDGDDYDWRSAAYRAGFEAGWGAR